MPSKKTILVTGGAGFIGSNFINFLLTNSEIREEIEIIDVDKITYAGKGRNLEYLGLDLDQRYEFIKRDICDKGLIRLIFKEKNPEFVFNFAAESHVDKSIEGSEPFVRTNVLGTTNLLDVAREFSVSRFIQISTDEVYGSIEEGSFTEDSFPSPCNPYAASKLAAEQMAFSYFKTHNLPVIVTRSANNFGPYQFPEKILPLFITNLIKGNKVPLMWSEENPGLNIRDWLHVNDNCRAIWFIANNGKIGEVYNISGENERTNISLTESLLDIFGFGEEMIERIPHRKGHDFRYSISGDKLNGLGFRHVYSDLDLELRNLVSWYKENEKWWGPLKK